MKLTKAKGNGENDFFNSLKSRMKSNADKMKENPTVEDGDKKEVKELEAEKTEDKAINKESNKHKNKSNYTNNNKDNNKIKNKEDNNKKNNLLFKKEYRQ